jgi:C-terminal processing protease CtpA/Prc
MSVRRTTSLCALAVTALALEAPAARAQADCSPLGQTTFVRTVLDEYYLWYRQLPDADPALFGTPEAYLEAVRYRALDSSFSYIGLRQAEDAFYSDSQFIGFGFSTKLSGDELRVSQVYPDSPASEAGLRRGDRLLVINGRGVAELIAGGELGGVFGPAQVGVAGDLVWSDLEGAERRASMTKRLVTIPTVSLVRVYEVEGRRVGYVVFRNFVQPSIAALDQAFAQLVAEGATDLVLDLRYNGGGLVSVAQHLGGLIGGGRTTGQVFVQFVHNDKNSFRDSAARFAELPGALSQPRLIVITTRASASASELLVNSLRPFMPVVIVGDATYGKPVGQYGFNFCEKVLYPVAFSTRNAQGEGDYFDGLAPTCAAADDLEHAFGDPAEGSLAEALHYAVRGGCSPRASAAARGHAARRLDERRAPRPDAWQVLLGAH